MRLLMVLEFYYYGKWSAVRKGDLRYSLGFSIISCSILNKAVNLPTFQHPILKTEVGLKHWLCFSSLENLSCCWKWMQGAPPSPTHSHNCSLIKAEKLSFHLFYILDFWIDFIFMKRTLCLKKKVWLPLVYMS